MQGFKFVPVTPLWIDVYLKHHVVTSMDTSLQLSVVGKVFCAFKLGWGKVCPGLSGFISVAELLCVCFFFFFCLEHRACGTL